MFISIIIPVYNVEQYLRECLDSVVSQSFDDYEVVCINDGSSDGSLAILEEYKNRYSKIQVISQQNKGLSGARNVGIIAAKGDYVFFLDSDDWIEPNTLQILFDNNTGQDLLCFNGRRYFEDGTTEEADSGIIENNMTGWDYYNKYALLNRKFHFVCTVLRIYKRQFLLDNMLYFKEGIFHEDNLFTPVVCYFAKSVKVIPNCLYIYRIRVGSITHSISYKNVFDMVVIANSLSDFFIPKQGIDKKHIYRDIAGKYFRVLLPDLVALCGVDSFKINKLINWRNFKKVCVFKRHKRLYSLLRIHPVMFNLYLKFEKLSKK